MAVLCKAFILLLFISNLTTAQSLQLSETLIVCDPSLKEVQTSQELQSYMLESYIPAWNKATSKAKMFLLKADRGDKNEKFLIASVAGIDDHTAKKNLLLRSYFPRRLLDYPVVGRPTLKALNGPIMRC